MSVPNKKILVLAQNCHIGKLIAQVLSPHPCKVVCKEEDVFYALQESCEVLIFEDTESWFHTLGLVKPHSQRLILAYSLHENIISHPLLGVADKIICLNSSNAEILAALS